MQLRAALQAGVRYLEESAVGSPRMNAEVLLMFTLACDRAYLYAHAERELIDREMESYRSALSERARGVPAQYITGHQEFWGLDLIVSPAVLIPRPETEHVVETVLELVDPIWRRLTSEPESGRTAATSAVSASKAGESGRGTAPGLRIVDVGTGSGAIALALAHELPCADVWATDISSPALEIARANAARLRFANRVAFVESDLLAGLDLNLEFDFVVSNPPYVGEGEEDKVQREVKKFEPRLAVFAGHDGLDVIRRLVPQACARLRPGGWLLMEIGYTQESKVRSLLSSYRPWTELRTIPDLQGIPRVIAARK